MEDFKKGYYTASLKKEMKPEANIGQYSFTQHQPFSQQSQQPGIQQNHQQQKQTQKRTHVLTPMSKEKPRKKVKSALQQEVSKLNPSGQMSMKQFIKVVLNLQEESRSQRRTMRSQCNNLTQQKEQNQDSYPRKESQALFETYHIIRIVNPNISFRNKLNWITDSENRIKIVNIQERVKRNWSYTNGN